MKTYKIIGGECLAISLVEDPAIEENFIKLSKIKEIKLDSDKREIFGPVLRPNFPIYRNQDGEEFYIVFDEEAIKKLSTDFLNHIQFTIDHLDNTTDVQIMESYIDNEGNWMIRCKILNEELWNRIKDGELNGFSIESIVDMDIINEIKSLLSANPTYDEVTRQLGDLTSENAQLVADKTKLEEDVKNLTEEIERLKVERDDLAKQLEDKTKESESKDEEITELSKQPSVSPSNKYNFAIKFLMSNK